jgi:hypothetical protein
VAHLRQFLRGWAKNLSGSYRVENEHLLLIIIIDFLDCKAETDPLNEVARSSLRKAQDAIAKLSRDEKTKWAQCAKVKHVQEGGENTKYLYLIANRKHRRKKNFQLERADNCWLGET